MFLARGRKSFGAIVSISCQASSKGMRNYGHLCSFTLRACSRMILRGRHRSLSASDWARRIDEAALPPVRLQQKSNDVESVDKNGCG